jgi:hypothetical protein
VTCVPTRDEDVGIFSRLLASAPPLRYFDDDGAAGNVAKAVSLERQPEAFLVCRSVWRSQTGPSLCARSSSGDPTAVRCFRRQR